MNPTEFDAADVLEEVLSACAAVGTILPLARARQAATLAVSLARHKPSQSVVLQISQEVSAVASRCPSPRARLPLPEGLGYATPWRKALERESAYKTLSRQQRYSVVLLLGGLIAAGCAGKTINDILADPQRYANQDIEMAGNVVESFSVIGKGFYRVEDGTGKLWFIPPRECPGRGHESA